MQRALASYGDTRYARLATISPSHLYNLRQRTRYPKRRRSVPTTRATQVRIGERRRPEPHGRPGYLRIDTVHQGDFRWTEGRLSHQRRGRGDAMAGDGRHAENLGMWLIPVLEAMLAQFPVRHSRLPFRQRQRVHQPRCGAPAGQTADRTNQVALAPLQRQRSGGGQERRRDPQASGLWLHRAPSPRRSAFYGEHLNPYVNFHRPCPFAEEITDPKGQNPQTLPATLGDDAVRETGHRQQRATVLTPRHYSPLTTPRSNQDSRQRGGRPDE